MSCQLRRAGSARTSVKNGPESERADAWDGVRVVWPFKIMERSTSGQNPARAPHTKFAQKIQSNVLGKNT